MMTINGFHHVAITVSDLDRSCEWYSTLLGLQEDFREDSPTRRACIMRHDDSGTVIGFVQHDPTTGPFDASRLGLDHLAFTVPTRQELDRCAEALADAGVTQSGPVDVPV